MMLDWVWLGKDFRPLFRGRPATVGRPAVTFRERAYGDSDPGQSTHKLFSSIIY